MFAGYGWFLCLALALRAVVPAGYMPAPLESGAPFHVCPSTLPAGAYALLAPAATSETAGPGEASHPHDPCPYAPLLSAGLPGPEAGAALPVFAAEPPVRAAALRPVLRSARAFEARAPPAVS